MNLIHDTRRPSYAAARQPRTGRTASSSNQGAHRDANCNGAAPALTPGSEEALILSAGLATLAGLSLVARASGTSVGSLLTTRFLLAGVPRSPCAAWSSRP